MPSHSPIALLTYFVFHSFEVGRRSALLLYRRQQNFFINFQSHFQRWVEKWVISLTRNGKTPARLPVVSVKFNRGDQERAKYSAIASFGWSSLKESKDSVHRIRARLFHGAPGTRPEYVQLRGQFSSEEQCLKLNPSYVRISVGFRFQFVRGVDSLCPSNYRRRLNAFLKSGTALATL